MLTSLELTRVLRNSGYKVTPQRLAVYEELTKEAWHPSAEMLYERVKEKYPAMSLATVYKTMEILYNVHVIRVLNTPEASLRYDGDISDHAHCQCTICNAIADIWFDKDELTRKVETETEYTITSKELYFFGICPACRKSALEKH
ncbi:MAG: transcriptional repressor [Phascolarctobacterium sp.]|nr:transcriptional repressor [Phascolarctobacterium sp.]